jgi:ligand-binding sensor domain-containing protein
MTNDPRFNNRPTPIWNRPGLEQLAYRIGDYGSFKQRLLAALPTALQPPSGTSGDAPLADLTTRDDSDPAIALLDAWAVVADVLTFYQERIANEGYLRTATERLSVLELARAIGYELDPGVAASTYLSFQVEDAPGSPTVVPIPERTQIMSVPAKDELPQIFETIAPFTAHLAWNGLRPRAARPQRIDPSTRQLYLAGTSTQLQAGDILLLVDDVPDRRTYLLPLHTVSPDTTADYTQVQWRQSIPSIAAPLRRPQLFAFRLQAHLFGYNAPNWETMPPEVKLAAIEKGGGTIQGGVFRSASDGLLWTPASQGLPDQDITCLAVKQGPDGNPLVFVGTPEKGIFRSSNSEKGETWKAVNSGLTNLKIQILHVDSEGDPIYAGTPGGGVFRSKDNGDNWVAINTGSVQTKRIGEEPEQWESVNNSLPDTVVRSLLTYTYETHKGSGTIKSNGPNVTGVDTKFAAEIVPGDFIGFEPEDNSAIEVDSLFNNNPNLELTLKSPFGFLPENTSYSASADIHSKLVLGDLIDSIQSKLRSLFRSIKDNALQIKNRSEDFFDTLTNFTGDILPVYEGLDNLASIAEASFFDVLGIDSLSADLELANFTTTIILGTGSSGEARISSDEINQLASLINVPSLMLSSNPVSFFPSITDDGSQVIIPGFNLIKNLLDAAKLGSQEVDKSTQIEVTFPGLVSSSIVRTVVDQGSSTDSSIQIDQAFEPAISQTSFPFQVTIRHTISSKRNIGSLSITFEETTRFIQDFIPVPLFGISLPTPLFGTRIYRDIQIVNLEMVYSLSHSNSSTIQSVGIAVTGSNTSGHETRFLSLKKENNPYSLPTVTSWTANITSGGRTKKIDTIESDSALTIEEPFEINLEPGTEYFIFSEGKEKIFRRKYIFAGTDDGLYYSPDLGRNWYHLGDEEDIKDKAIYSLAYSVDGPEYSGIYHVFAGTNSGLYRSSDHGVTWRWLSGNDDSLHQKTVFSLLTNSQNRKDSSTLLVGTNAGLYQFSDYGDVAPLNSTFNDLIIYSLAASERDDFAYAFAATSQGLYRTIASTAASDPFAWTNTQENWKVIQKGAISPLQFISVTAGEDATIYAGSQFSGFLPETTDSANADSATPADAEATDNDPMSIPKKPEWPDFVIQDPRQLDLDTLYPQILPESWVVLVDDRDPNDPEEQAEPRYAVRQVPAIALLDRQDFALTGKISRLELAVAVDPQQFGLRSARLLGQSTELPLALEPLTVTERQRDIFADPVMGDTVYLQTFVPNLQSNQTVMVNGQHMRMELADVGGILRSRHDWQPMNAGLCDLTINDLIVDTNGSASQVLAATNEGLYRFSEAEKPWETVSPLRFKAVHSLFLAADLLLVGADLELYRAAPSDGNLVKVDLPIAATILKLASITVRTEVTINVVSISGITLQASADLAPDSLPIGTLITVEGQTRIVTHREADNRTFLINEILEPSLSASTSAPVMLTIGGSLWLAGTDRGLLRSTDAGQTWHRLSALQDRQVYSLHLQATAATVEVFVGTDQGLQHSENGGQTWQRLDALWEQQTHPAVYALALRSQTLFIGTGQGLFRRLSDRVQKLDGLCDRAIYTLYFADSVLYAGTDQGIYRANHPSQSWEALDTGLPAAEGRTLLVHNDELLVGTEQGVFAAPADGQRIDPVDWSRSNTGIVNSQILSLAHSPDATTILAGTTAGLYRSTSAGRTWVPFDDDLDQAQAPGKLSIQAVLISDGGTWFVGTPEGVFVYGATPDEPDRDRWQLIGPDTLPYPDVRAIAVQSNWLWVGTVNGGLFKLDVRQLAPTTRGQTPADQLWQPTGLNNTDVQTIAVHTAAIYVGTVGDGIFRSVDDGNTWDRITDERSGPGSLVSDGNRVTWSGEASVDWLQAGDQIIAAGQTRTILDVGERSPSSMRFTIDAPFRPDLLTRTAFTMRTGLTNPDVTVLQIPATPKNAEDDALGNLVLYAGTAGSGVFRSEDGGDRWQQIINNLDDLKIRCLLCEGPDTVWVGTETAGIFRSINRGDLWAPATHNLTNTDVRALIIPDQFTLIAGGIGILKSVDGLTVKSVQRHDVVRVVQPPRPNTPTVDSVTNRLSAPQLSLSPTTQLPTPAPDDRWLLRDKEGFVGLLDTTAEQVFPLLPADADDALVSEHAQIKYPPTDQQLPILTLQASMTYSYDPATVTIAANVVHATHGETVTEILGSGEGTAANQQFELKQPPLTYVPAPTARGSESTLEVRVDEVLWDEVSSLYTLKPSAQAYIIRLADDGTTTLTFGDGVRGARLPSGQENITARYRSGIGTDGNIAPHRLSVLKTRPQGIADVTNALAATGAANRESLEAARTNAPPTARTLGRIVSLQDFQDFAQGFGGIGKSLAVALWDGNTQVVHITIAGTAGALVSATSALYASLVAAIDRARDPLQQVAVAAYERLFFNLEGKVLLDSRYQADTVEPQLTTALHQTFAFDRRRFGQAVTSAEVIEALQAVPGVIAVDLDALYVAGRSRSLNATLIAQTARYNSDTDTIQPAQLLQLSPVGIQLNFVATL